MGEINWTFLPGWTFKAEPSNLNFLTNDAETLLPIQYETHAFDLDHAKKLDELEIQLHLYLWVTESEPKELPWLVWKNLLGRWGNESVSQPPLHRRTRSRSDFRLHHKCTMTMYCQTVTNDYNEWQFCRDKNRLIRSAAQWLFWPSSRPSNIPGISLINNIYWFKT